MVIYLYGPDSYRRRQKLNELVAGYKDKNSAFSVENFAFENGNSSSPYTRGGWEGLSNFLAFKNFCSQQGMFAIKKLAILEGISELEKNDFDFLKNLIEQNIDSKDFIIIINDDQGSICPLLKRGTGGFFLIDSNKKIITQEFPKLTGAKLELFIKQEAQKRHINLDTSATQFLANNFNPPAGGDTWGLINELDKLEFLKTFLLSSRGTPRDLAQKEGRDSSLRYHSAQNDAPITEKHLQELIFSYSAPDLFGFINAISKNKGMNYKIVLLEKLFLNQEEPAKIFNILAKNPYLSFSQIKALADYDVEIKSGKNDYDLALLELALS